MVEYEGALSVAWSDSGDVAGYAPPPTHIYAGETFDTLIAPGLLAGVPVRERLGGATDTAAIGQAMSVSHPHIPTRAAASILWVRPTGTFERGNEHQKPARSSPLKLKTDLLDGMFLLRDKLPRIGVVVTVTGIPLGNTDVILNGINHREIVKTDERGIWWKYLEIDEYPDALFISPNGIVYALLNQKEREDNEGIFDQMVTRRTIANATNRQIHRRFV